MLQFFLRRLRTARVPVEEASTAGIRRVKVTRNPGVKFSRSFTQAFLLYCACRTLSLWIYGPDAEAQKKLEEAIKAQPEAHKAIIIPIPGWVKQLGVRVYKPDDPHRKAIVEFFQDRKAAERLHSVFETAILKQISQEPLLSYLRGIGYDGNPQNIRRNIDVVPPTHPPTYVNRCIVFKPTGVSLGWRELSVEKGAMMRRMLQPAAFAQALWCGGTAFAQTTTAIYAAKYQDLVEPERQFSVVTELSPRGTNTYATVTATNVQSVIRNLPSARMDAENAQKMFPFLRGNLEEGSGKSVLRSHVQSLAHQSALEHATFMFKREFSRRYTADISASTPGAVTLSGYYEFIGRADSVVKMDVMAVYLPEQEKFILRPRVTQATVRQRLADPEKQKSDPGYRHHISDRTSPKDMSGNMPSSGASPQTASNRPAGNKDGEKKDEPASSPSKP